MAAAAARAKGSAWEIEVADAAAAGLPGAEARAFVAALRKALEPHPREGAEAAAWAAAAPLLRPDHPHALHQLVYYSAYAKWDRRARGPPPCWFPSPEKCKNLAIWRVVEAYGPKFLGPSYKDPISSYSIFQKYTAEHPDVFWAAILKELPIKFQQEPNSILDTSNRSRDGGMWLPGAVLNIAESCLLPVPALHKSDDAIAIVWRDEGYDELPVNSMSYKVLREQVMLVANALDTMFERGDAIAIDMPMTCTAVIIYLAIVLAGCVVVSIADSFAAKEIGVRVNVSKAKVIFTQDFIIRGEKKVPLYSRVAEGTSQRAVVIPSNGRQLEVTLRENDLSWKDFISRATNLARPHYYSPVYQSADSVTNILFSSGTTGEPKAIPWTQVSPIRSSVETWLHAGIEAGDVYCWPTNLGWVMGPSVLYAAFFNGGCLALYQGSPLGRGFGKFVQDAGVTVLGTVPSMVKTWKYSNCMKGLDWSKIRAFATTGETSDVDDDLWLSSRAFYKPVLEICGGTELASGYLHGSLVQPQALGAFSTPSVSTGFVILDDQGTPYPDDQPCIGEVALFPFYMGASNRILNADHRKVYFEGMPIYKGVQLRRHGDIVERTVGGYYIVHGRADDTMNLGGIKTSSVEIERVCNKADENVLETAAVSFKLVGGGPEKLAVLVVLKSGFGVLDAELLRMKFQKAIQSSLNPLFKVSYVKFVPEFPRTASNKLLRRVLRDQLKQELSAKSKL